MSQKIRLSICHLSDCLSVGRYLRWPPRTIHLVLFIPRIIAIIVVVVIFVITTITILVLLMMRLLIGSTICTSVVRTSIVRVNVR